jgi:hypothetical protein
MYIVLSSSHFAETQNSLIAAIVISIYGRLSTGGDIDIVLSFSRSGSAKRSPLINWLLIPPETAKSPG